MKKNLLIALAAFALVVCYLLFVLPDFVSKPAPARDYAEAVKRYEALRAEEAKLPLAANGHTKLLTHGAPTERVFVLLHGLTNSPQQFARLGQVLFDSGANVIIPRAKYAGFADVLNDVQGRQNAQDLIDQAATGLDIAAGLGKEISLVGLSGSAVSAAWMAQNREGIDRVVILSPFFGMHGKPVALIDSLAAVLSRLPTFYVWWNSTLREKNPGPPYAYPRFGTVTMADTVQLSRVVRRDLPAGPLKAKSLHILTTASDIGASTPLARSMAREWEARFPGRVTYFEFPASAGVPHDMVDALQPDARVDLTYPVILKALDVKP
jgi:carboxylesterase